MTRCSVALIAIPFFLAGCGGGQTSTQGDSGSVHTTSLGQGSVTYTGKIVPAASASFNGVTVTTMAGASFTHVSLSPVPAVQNSLVAYSINGQIWTVQNGVQTQITHGLLFADYPALSKTGQVAFQGFDPVGNRFQIYVCNYDGSALHRVTSSTFGHFTPAWSPSGTKLACSLQNDGVLATVNQDGTGETTLNITGANLNATSLSFPTWSPDGSKIAFQGFNSTSGHYSIFTAPSSGGTATEVTSFGATHCYAPCWSPDGTEIGLLYGNNQVFAISLQNNGVFSIVATAPANSTVNRPCFSPDGGSIVYEEISSTGTAIKSQPVSLNGASTVLASSSSTAAEPVDPAWSPYFGAKTFIGSGGQMATGSGFLWSQLGDAFGSFVSLSATTPSNLTIALQPAGGAGGPAVYLAKADAITNIVFSNVYYGAKTALAPTGSTQALISLSTSTGHVDVIAPLAEPARAAPAVRNGVLAYDGKFTAIFDSSGKDLAPGGASHLEIGKKTGELTSWR